MRKGDDIVVRITRVVDGDTVDVEDKWGDTIRVRLYAIDAPERSQPYGNWATDVLNSVNGSDWMLRVQDTDRYGRVVGVFYDGEDIQNSLNVQMVRGGVAYHYDRYGALPGGSEAEAYARVERAGLWAHDLEHPADYRRRMRGGQGGQARKRKRDDVDWFDVTLGILRWMGKFLGLLTRMSNSGSGRRHRRGRR